MPNLCHQLLSTGACGDLRCTLRHDFTVCDLCGVLCGTPSAYQSHANGKKHRRRVQNAGQPTLRHCEICNLNISGRKNWDQHLKGRTHITNAQGVQVAPDVPQAIDDPIPGFQFCSVCQSQIPNSAWGRHSNASRHTARLRFMAYQTKLEEAERDKHGVNVVGSADFGIVEVENAERGVSARLILRSDLPRSTVQVIGARLTSDTFSFKFDTENRAVRLGKSVSLSLLFRQGNRGRYQERLEIVFEDSHLQKQFVISRSVNAIVGSQADHALLMPKAPYVPRVIGPRQPEKKVFPAELPPSLNAVPYVVKLPNAAIPKAMTAALSSGKLSDIVKTVQKMFFPSKFNGKTYAQHFKALVWLEEARMELDLARYDIGDATMTKSSYFYQLPVPGLAEKRPSVLVGDRILFQKADAPSGTWYEGAVHFVRQEEVGLKFHTSFGGWTPTQKYSVRFKLNRIPVKRQHQALDTAFYPDRLLFPSPAHILPTKQILPLRFHNKQIGENLPQRQAVEAIVRQKPGSVPFIVFGPPGTGKTVTIVEAIRQVLINNPSARVLACAPSNSAADLITERLMDLGTKVMFRFYAPSRNKEATPDKIKPFTFQRQGDGFYSCPIVSVLKTYRVVVSTCVSASFAYGVGMPRGHFTHMFFDEAGQATEPEVMISIKTMADNATNVILSGDPKQLGPIIRSDVARKLGLETSYIERLMKIGGKDEGEESPSNVVKLVKNFRSHNSILKFPNEQFYKGELQQCGDPKDINAYLSSSQLVSKRFPIVFHAITGKDDREASSPSFFNIDEILQVKAYVNNLKGDRQTRSTDNDIGIISPYHAQCKKIRTALKQVADEVKVGSVEEFQGQERKIIIISTVRSSRNFVEYDLHHTLGFVANPRRFNVAVTRAKALLIVVGDPSVLGLDPLWRSFLNYIHINGGWRGAPIPWDSTEPVEELGDYARGRREQAINDMNDFARRMEEMTLAEIDGDTNNSEDLDVGAVDRPWREVE